MSPRSTILPLVRAGNGPRHPIDWLATIRAAAGIDSALGGLAPHELDAVERLVGAWERTCWVDVRQAIEWRRRIAARRALLRLLPDIDRHSPLRIGGCRRH